jgi:acyl-lipid omega-6 desaturase (Delta-12 desaturase)
VHLTNLSLVALHGALAAILGVGPVVAVLLAVIVSASVVGVWLFSLQQHFDGSLATAYVQAICLRNR